MISKKSFIKLFGEDNIGVNEEYIIAYFYEIATVKWYYEDRTCSVIIKVNIEYKGFKAENKIIINNIKTIKDLKTILNIEE